MTITTEQKDEKIREEREIDRMVISSWIFPSYVKLKQRGKGEEYSKNSLRYE